MKLTVEFAPSRVTVVDDGEPDESFRVIDTGLAAPNTRKELLNSATHHY